MQPDGRLLDPAAKPTAQGETFVKHVLERLAEAYCSILGLQSSKIIKRLSKRLLEVVLAAFEQVGPLVHILVQVLLATDLQMKVTAVHACHTGSHHAFGPE